MSDESMPLGKVNAERAATEEHIMVLERRYQEVGAVSARNRQEEPLCYDAIHVGISWIRYHQCLSRLYLRGRSHLLL